jgi:hypothetical protein
MCAVKCVFCKWDRRITEIARIVRIAVTAVAIISHTWIGDHIPTRCDVGGILDVGVFQLQAGVYNSHDNIC